MRLTLLPTMANTGVKTEDISVEKSEIIAISGCDKKKIYVNNGYLTYNVLPRCM